MARKMRFSMASRTGCMKVGVKIKPLSPLTPSISHPVIQHSESLTIITFSSYRGDVLIRSGLLVVTWREVPGLHRVQWHPGPHHRVQLVWRWAVPQHCLHPLSKGGTSRQFMQLQHACIQITAIVLCPWIVFFLPNPYYLIFCLCSQVLPTLR